MNAAYRSQTCIQSRNPFLFSDDYDALDVESLTYADYPDTPNTSDIGVGCLGRLKCFRSAFRRSEKKPEKILSPNVMSPWTIPAPWHSPSTLSSESSLADLSVFPKPPVNVVDDVFERITVRRNTHVPRVSVISALSDMDELLPLSETSNPPPYESATCISAPSPCSTNTMAAHLPHILHRSSSYFDPLQLAFVDSSESLLCSEDALLHSAALPMLDSSGDVPQFQMPEISVFEDDDDEDDYERQSVDFLQLSDLEDETEKLLLLVEVAEEKDAQKGTPLIEHVLGASLLLRPPTPRSDWPELPDLWPRGVAEDDFASERAGLDLSNSTMKVNAKSRSPMTTARRVARKIAASTNWLARTRAIRFFVSEAR